MKFGDGVLGLILDFYFMSMGMIGFKWVLKFEIGI